MMHNFIIMPIHYLVMYIMLSREKKMLLHLYNMSVVFTSYKKYILLTIYNYKYVDMNIELNGELENAH